MIYGESGMMNKSATRAAWIEFIKRYQYEWYLTLTFKFEVSPEHAVRQFNHFIRKINEQVYGRRYREKKQGVHFVRVIENQQRGVIHFHSLIGGGSETLSRWELSRIWHSNNGIADIQPYDPSQRAIEYLTKTISKGGEIDIYHPSLKGKH